MKWQEVELRDVCSKILSGGTPSTERTEYWGGDIPWVTSADIVSHNSIQPKKFITPNAKANILPKGNVLVVTRVGLGKVAVSDVDLAFSQDVQGLVLKPEVDTRYLVYVLTKKVERFKEVSRGATIKGVTRNDLETIRFSLPPLTVQKQIADTLDKADSLRQKDQQLLRKYDELAQSIFYEMFGDPVENDQSWDLITLEQLGEWRSGGTPSRNDPKYFTGDIPWLSSGELETMYVTHSKEHITIEAIENSAAKLIEPRSLLLGMYDTAALKSSINLTTLCCNQAIAFAKLDEQTCSPEFVYYYIQLAKEHLRREQRGVRQKNMNLSMIRNLPVINPPVTKQYEFAHALSRIERQKRQVQESTSFSGSLFIGLLKEYFA